MLYRIKPQKPLELALPDILGIAKPNDLSLLFYGFNSLRYALSSLHPEGVSSLMKNRLEKLIAATDVDLTICPESQALKNLADTGALDYYLAIQQRMKMSTHPERLSERQKTYAFLGFKHQDIDCSLQAKPLALQIHSSSQAFYDLHKQEFIFKDANSYQNFLMRRLYTPELESLFERAKNDGLVFKTLIFVLKNHLKMRYVGWTLSDHDRTVIMQAASNKSFMKRVNKSLQEMLNDYPFIEELKHELGVQTSNIDFLLKERDIEQMEYLVYRASKTTETLAEDIEWLQAQVTCTSQEKLKLIDRFCKEVLSDRSRSDDDKLKFISMIDPSIISQIDTLKKWSPKKKSPSPVSSPVLFSSPSPTHQNHALYKAKHFDVKQITPPAEVPSIDELMVKLAQDARERFEDEHNQSVHRFFLCCSIIPVLTYQGADIKGKQGLEMASPILSLFILSAFSFIALNSLSRITFSYRYHERAKNLLVFQALEDMMTYREDQNQTELAFTMIALALKAGIDTNYLMKNHESDPPLPIEGPRLFNIKKILRHIREAKVEIEGVVSLQSILKQLCLFCTRHNLKLEDAFIERIQVPDEFDIQVETLRSELKKTLSLIETHVQAYKPIDKALMALLSSYFLLSIQGYMLHPEENSWPLVHTFLEETLLAHGSDPAMMHRLYTEPLNLFLQTKENRLALSIALNELSSHKKSFKNNDQLPNMSYA